MTSNSNADERKSFLFDEKQKSQQESTLSFHRTLVPYLICVNTMQRINSASEGKLAGQVLEQHIHTTLVLSVTCLLIISHIIYCGYDDDFSFLSIWIDSKYMQMRVNTDDGMIRNEIIVVKVEIESEMK